MVHGGSSVARVEALHAGERLLTIRARSLFNPKRSIAKGNHFESASPASWDSDAPVPAASFLENMQRGDGLSAWRMDCHRYVSFRHK